MDKPVRRTLGFYHRGDLDGVCSGAILKKIFGSQIELYGVEYGDKIDFNKIVQKGDLVYVVDFSFEPFTKMLELNKYADLIWFDHHVTVINEVKHSGVEFKGQFGDLKNSKSAAYIVWEAFHPKIPVPKGVELISLYDTWQHEFKDDILNFYRGLETSTELNVHSPLWQHIFDNNLEFIQSVTNSGLSISKYIKTNNKQYALDHAIETEFDGYKAIAINKGFGGAFMFDSLWDENKYDIMIAFSRRNNNSWRLSLYTTKKNVDCSAIAKKYGGGGHKSAAGFEIKDINLPFGI